MGCFGLPFTGFTGRPPGWLELLVRLPLTGFMALASLRPCKATLVALRFHNRASEVRASEPDRGS